MAFIAFPGFQPGMIMTDDRLDSAALSGRLVFRATRDTSQSISNSSAGNPDAANALAWETVDVDDLGGWSSGSATRYTCQLAGWYRVDAKASFNASTASVARTLGIYLNGTLVPAGHFRNAIVPSNTSHSLTGFITLPLVAGDYVQMAPGQDSGGALNTATGGVRPLIEITFARPA